MEISQGVINLVFTAITGLAGWYATYIQQASNRLLEKLDEQQKKIQTLEVDVAKNYVPNDRFDKRFNEVIEHLTRIEQLLQTKADKP